MHEDTSEGSVDKLTTHKVNMIPDKIVQMNRLGKLMKLYVKTVDGIL